MSLRIVWIRELFGTFFPFYLYKLFGWFLKLFDGSWVWGCSWLLNVPSLELSDNNSQLRELYSIDPTKSNPDIFFQLL